MSSKTRMRWGLLLLLLAVLTVAMYSWNKTPDLERETCLGVEILPEDGLDAFTTYRHRDYSENLKFMDEYVALDQETGRIYISGNIGPETQPQELQGKLTLDVPGVTLYFAPDENWDQLSQAVRDGHGFRLLASGRGGVYMEYEVVFTTLPVISMNGWHLYEDDELRSVYSGRMTLWDPEAEESQTNRAHWHIRGGASRYRDKRAWKLSLKTWSGDNKNDSLLSLGSDDDWILNPMSMEDTNLREKLIADLWNELAEQTPYNYPMSRGEYVEVVRNGAYEGLYLLQRRVDDKYLDVEQDSIVVKAKESEETGEIEYDFFSPNNQRLTEEQCKSFFEDRNCEEIVLENFIDLNLFLQLFAAFDNAEHVKNIYYVFDKAQVGYAVSMIPWDVDMTLGIFWSNVIMGFDYDYEATIGRDVYRREWDAMLELHPQMYGDLCQRWFELREGVLEESHIRQKTQDYLDLLAASGADVRDQEKWGLYFEGEDTIDGFYRFLSDRLAMLDALYVQG